MEALERIIDKLGNASSQLILAAFVVAFGYVCWKLLTEVLSSYQSRITEARDLNTKYSTDASTMASVLKELKTTVDLALAALRKE